MKKVLSCILLFSLSITMISCFGIGKNADLDEEAYKSSAISCPTQEDYDTLISNPKSFKGEHMVVSGEVIDSGKNYWIIQTDNDGNGLFSDNLFYIKDKRKEHTYAFSKGDLMTVYGDFDGLKKVRTFLFSSSDAPVIDALYIDPYITIAQQIKNNAEQIISDFVIQEVPVYNSKDPAYAVIVTNTSPYDLRIDLSVKLYDAQNNILKADNATENFVESGTDVVFLFQLYEYNFLDIEMENTIDHADLNFSIEQASTIYHSMSSALEVTEVRMNDSKFFVSYKNSSDEAIETAYVYLLLYDGETCVYCHKQLVNGLDGLQARMEFTEEYYYNDDFDSYWAIPNCYNTDAF